MGALTGQADTNDLTLSMPLGVMPGDYLLAHICLDEGNSGVQVSSGWVPLGQYSVGVHEHRLYGRFADPTGPVDIRWSWSGGETIVAGAVSAYRGVDPANPHPPVTQDVGNNSMPKLSGATAPENNMLLVILVGFDATNSPQATTFTQRYVMRSNDVSGVQVLGGTEPILLAGPLPDERVTYGVGNEWTVFGVLLRPAP